MSYSFGHCIVKTLMNTNSLQRFASTDDGTLNAPMRDAFSSDGVIVLEDFVSVEECQRLRSRMLELIDELGQDSASFVVVTHDPAIARHMNRTLELREGALHAVAHEAVSSDQV